MTHRSQGQKAKGTGNKKLKGHGVLFLFMSLDKSCFFSMLKAEKLCVVVIRKVRVPFQWLTFLEHWIAILLKILCFFYSPLWIQLFIVHAHWTCKCNFLLSHFILIIYFKDSWKKISDLMTFKSLILYEASL